ncbi:MAG TPA: S1 family peptidase [Kofleriaceae bacterium]|jgi:uncharacterized protein (TIGR03382 family)
MSRWLVALAVTSSASASAQPVTSALPDTGHPAVVALVNADNQLVCTGAVIEAHTVITAAHCVAGDPLTLRAFFGSSTADGGRFIAVMNARAHPLFDPGGNDIALITLGDTAPSAPLALAPPLSGALVGTMIDVVGFGITGNGLGGEGIKRTGTAKIAGIAVEDFTAVPSPSLSCLGDSGGPALLAGDQIAGVVSRVDSQCVDHAVYTRIDVAQDVLIAPYLAETAPGAAGEGEPCFYDGHCADGLECRGTPHTCQPTSSGCNTSGSDPRSALIVVGALLFALGRRRSTRNQRRIARA